MLAIYLRAESPKNLNSIDSIFKTNVTKGFSDYNKTLKGVKLTLSINQVGNRPTGFTPSNADLVKNAQEAVRTFGKEPILTIGATNANIPISKGLPAITIGWGGMSDHFHSLNEWWLNDKGSDAIKLALLILLSEAGIAK